MNGGNGGATIAVPERETWFFEKRALNMGRDKRIRTISSFNQAIRHIKEIADQHKSGWQFLYTAKQTLFRNNRILFLGLNPGGGEDCRNEASSERGCAYRTGRWTKDDKPKPLQVQVQ